MILGDEQAFQNMGPFLGFSQVIFCPANDQLFLEGQIFVQNMAQGEDLRLCLVLYQGQHIDRERRLQRRLRIEPIQNNLLVGVLFQLDDDPHAIPVRLVPQVGDAFQPLFFDLVRNVLHQVLFVDLVG